MHDDCLDFTVNRKNGVFMKFNQPSNLAIILFFSFCMLCRQLLPGSSLEDQTSESIGLIQTLDQTSASLKPTQTIAKIFPDSIIYSQPVTLVANVVPSILPGEIPTGTIQFKINQQVIATQPLVEGTAKFTTTTIPASALEPYVVTTIYSGDEIYKGSGDTAGLVVSQASTSIQFISSYNPSAVGQSISFTANVFANSPAVAIPNGVVEFKLNGKLMAAMDLDSKGQAVFSSSDIPAGTHTIIATYRGNANFGENWAKGIQQINKVNTYIDIDSSSNPSEFGKSVKSLATVTSETIIPKGKVQFKVDGKELGLPQALDDKGETFMALPDLDIGSHRIEAHYLGDANFNSSVDSFTQKVNKANVSITMTANPTPSTIGELVNITAKVNPANPELSGSVQFKLDGKPIGEAQTLDDNKQSFVVVQDLNLGNHYIEAEYSGNERFNVATAHLTQQVNKMNAQVELSNLASFLASEQPLTLVVSVKTTVGKPTGTVQLFIDEKKVGERVKLDSKGQASLTIKQIEVGEHKIKAFYSGDYNVNPSTSTERHLTVQSLIPKPTEQMNQEKQPLPIREEKRTEEIKPETKELQKEEIDLDRLRRAKGIFIKKQQSND